MVRAVLGFIVGAVFWMTIFFVLTFSVAFVWPAYAEHGRTWIDSGVFTFEPPMAAVNVVAWALAEVFAGWVAVAIARRREAAWALAAVLALYLAALHLVLYLADLSVVVQRGGRRARCAGRAARR